MKQALGLVEIAGLCIAVAAADAMVKAANVELVELEPAKGGGYMTIKVVGDVGAVNAAVMAGCQIGKEHQKLVAWKVIPRPSDFVEDTFVTHKAEEPKKPGPDQTPEPPVETPEEAAETVKEEPEPEVNPEETQAAEEAEVHQPENKDSAEDKVAEDKRAEEQPAQEEKADLEAPKEPEKPQTVAAPKRPSRRTSRKK